MWSKNSNIDQYWIMMSTAESMNKSRFKLHQSMKMPRLHVYNFSNY